MYTASLTIFIKILFLLIDWLILQWDFKLNKIKSKENKYLSNICFVIIELDIILYSLSLFFIWQSKQMLEIKVV